MPENGINLLMTELRDLVNHYRIKSVLMEDTTNWLRLCSSMDVIEDTQLAIEAFQSDKLGDLLIDGFGYLQLYGLLQSLFLQQDAVKNIAKSVGIKFVLSRELRNIRELRNDTIGHPTDRDGGKYFCFVVRSSIYKSKFTYFKDKPKGDRFNEIHVDTSELISLQAESVSKALEEMISEIKNREQQHRDQFKGEKMLNAFPNVLNWYFSKIHEATSNHNLYNLALTHLSEIRKILSKLEEELERRGELSSADWFRESSNDVEYPLNQLEYFFQLSEECEINKITADIFIFYLRHQFDEMKSIAEEIDQDYEAPI